MTSQFNPSQFAVGQAVICNGIAGFIVGHYFEGMWDVRLPGGVACVSAARITQA